MLGPVQVQVVIHLLEADPSVEQQVLAAFQVALEEVLGPTSILRISSGGSLVGGGVALAAGETLSNRKPRS
jgi:hypothetical protein